MLKLHSTKQIKVPIFNQRIFSASKPAWRIFDRLWIWLVLHRSSSNQILSWSISQRAVYWQQKVITVHFANMQQVLLFFSEKNKEAYLKLAGGGVKCSDQKQTPYVFVRVLQRIIICLGNLIFIIIVSRWPKTSIECFGFWQKEVFWILKRYSSCTCFSVRSFGDTKLWRFA